MLGVQAASAGELGLAQLPVRPDQKGMDRHDVAAFRRRGLSDPERGSSRRGSKRRHVGQLGEQLPLAWGEPGRDHHVDLGDEVAAGTAPGWACPRRAGAAAARWRTRAARSPSPRRPGWSPAPSRPARPPTGSPAAGRRCLGRPAGSARAGGSGRPGRGRPPGRHPGRGRPRRPAGCAARRPRPAGSSRCRCAGRRCPASVHLPSAAPVGLLDGQREFGLLVGAGHRRAAPAPAEEPAQQVLEVDPGPAAAESGRRGSRCTRRPGSRRPRPPGPGVPTADPGPAPTRSSQSSGTRRKSVAEAVVAAACLRIRQHVVRLVDLLEPLLGRRVPVHVRVVGPGQPPVGACDLLRAGVATRPRARRSSRAPRLTPRPRRPR